MAEAASFSVRCNWLYLGCKILDFRGPAGMAGGWGGGVSGGGAGGGFRTYFFEVLKTCCLISHS